MSGSQTGTLADLREALATRQAATAAQGGTAAAEAADQPNANPNATHLADPMPPVGVRSRWRGSGSSPARARSP